MLSFALNKDFVNGYSSKKEPFGFNGLGSLVYHRTYSRVKSDGTKEQWFDMCERVMQSNTAGNGLTTRRSVAHRTPTKDCST